MISKDTIIILFFNLVEAMIVLIIMSNFIGE